MHKTLWESSVSWQVQAYRYLLSSSTGLCGQEDHDVAVYFDRGTGCKYFDKGIVKGQVWVP